MIGEFQNRVFFALVNQSMIDFIRDDVRALLALGQVGNLLHAFGRQEVACWIGRRVDKYAFCSGAQFFPYRFRPVLKSVFFIYGNGNRASLDEFNKIGIAGVVGIGNDDFISRFQQS